jgi:LPXTG-motif cell wall-anchored protein
MATGNGNYEDEGKSDEKAVDHERVASPTATVAAKAQYDGGGKKEVVVGGGGRTLPETGGVSSIALLAGALLIGGGVMSLALFRRS